MVRWQMCVVLSQKKKKKDLLWVTNLQRVEMQAHYGLAAPSTLPHACVLGTGSQGMMHIVGT